jgi:hypothetical protein
MRDPHYRRHLEEIHGRIAWVRSLVPDSPRYRLWLGDLVEMVNAAYGVKSPQMESLSAVLQELRTPPDADDDARQRTFLARLDAIDRLLTEWEAGA